MEILSLYSTSPNFFLSVIDLILVSSYLVNKVDETTSDTHVFTIGEDVDKREPLYTVVGNAN